MGLVIDEGDQALLPEGNETSCIFEGSNWGEDKLTERLDRMIRRSSEQRNEEEERG